MSDPYLGEIRAFAFDFAPQGWALCNGQLLPLSQNTALFSLLGTTYGGNGKSNFALPNLMGRVPLQQGQDQGLSLYDLGQEGGTEYVQLLESEIPFHSHGLSGTEQPADLQAPGPSHVLGRTRGGSAYQSTTNTNLTQHDFQSLGPAGGGLPHNNMQPFLCLNFCIALQGAFPPRH